MPAPPRVLAAPESKLALLRERFNLLAQRLARNKLFSRPALRGVSTGSGYCEVTPLQALLGTAGETRFVLGALSQLEEGRFWLEDCTGSVGVDLTDAATSAGLFTEGCVVLAEGELRRDGIFQARALGFPPCEPRRDSLQALGSLDLFGAGHLRCVRALTAPSARALTHRAARTIARGWRRPAQPRATRCGSCWRTSSWTNRWWSPRCAACWTHSMP